MKYILLFTFSIGFFSFGGLKAQEHFYHIDSIPEIRIYFEQADWDHLLDSFYVEGENERLLATLVIDGEVLDSVGIRYKGFSSVSTSRKKNPFNIKLDYVINNQKYDGIDKIKLGNVIQDPSFLREVLSYEIGRKYMPASLANYANVFINDERWGLYTNVEAVNKDFLAQHYGSNDNAFFKCNPETLDFDGENSNLGNAPGTDSTAYYPYYDIESDYGWAELYELIDVLNESPEDIETLLNVDRTLWMHAFNYALINFDSYVGYAQNYYLYKDDNSRFNPIIWDLNMSFASYRFTDASEHFDGFSIAEAKTMDPLLHYSSVSVIPRPLMRNLFENDTFRRMYIAHLRTIIEENFASQEYLSRAQYLQDLIESSVLADTNKFYSDTDFYENINNTVTDLISYPGITDLMDARTSYLQNYPGYQGAPDISNINHTPQNYAPGDEIWIRAEIVNADNVTLAYRYGGQGLFQKIAMQDDGNQNDGAANDGIFGIKLNNVANSIQYFIYAENAESGRFTPERAAYEYFLIQANISPGDVVINEFMAANGNTVADENGEYDDWIELYNNTTFDISTAGLYLSDDQANLKKWALPNLVIQADDYMIIWADDDESQGALHASFKLLSEGETLMLVDENEAILDSITFGLQTEDISTGRIPNGTGPFVEMPPTFKAPNSLTAVEEPFLLAQIQVFPNPANGFIYLEFETQIPTQVNLNSMDGKVFSCLKNNSKEAFLKMSLESLSNGVYFLSFIFEDVVINRKIIVQK